MPAFKNTLSLTDLSRRNYNSLELMIWDIPNNIAAVISNFNVTQNGTQITVAWGDKKTNTSTQKSFTVSHTY